MFNANTNTLFENPVVGGNDHNTKTFAGHPLMIKTLREEDIAFSICALIGLLIGVWFIIPMVTDGSKKGKKGSKKSSKKSPKRSSKKKKVESDSDLDETSDSD